MDQLTTQAETWGQNLTPRRREFVRQYVALNNGSAAARKAGYSERSASTEASRLLRNDEVIEALQTYRQIESSRLNVTPESILQEIAQIAFADLGHYVKLDGGVPVLDLAELPPGATRALSSIGHSQYGITFKMHDKLAALTTLARSFGLLVGEAPGVSIVVNEGDKAALSGVTSEQLRAGIRAMSGVIAVEASEVSPDVDGSGAVSPSTTRRTGATEGSDLLSTEASEGARESRGGALTPSDSTE